MSEIKKENILIYEEGVPSNDNNSSTPSEEKPYQRFLKRIQVKGGEDGQPWSNPDLVPTPIEDQNWKPYAYLAYWISDSYNAAGWRTAGSFITKGLSPGWTYGCNVLGHVVIAFIVAIHGLFGSKYHVPFTVQSRAAFGFYFSHVIVFMRFIVGCYYYGINAYTGAECVQAMIYAMSPRFKHMKNTIHDGSTTSSMLLCYFIYTVICLPFHYIHAKNIRKFLMFKAIVCPITGIAMMIWLNAKAGGTSIIWNQGSKAKGSKLSWLIVQCVTTSAASYSTLGVNVNDFTRYAANYHAPYAQLYAIPLIHGIMTPMGIVGSVATELIYGRAIWDPLLIAEEWIGTPRGRVAAFFVALSFLIAQIGINISANSISAANDLTALFPKYVNIRRGQFIIVLLGGWALCPWEVIANATTLTAFMGGYSIFLGPIAAVLMCDYFIVHRQKYDYEEFYNPNGIYRYGTRLGTNWRTIPPLLVGFVPLLPGLASYINKSIKLPQGVLNLYLVGYFYSFPVAFLTYYVVCLLFPPQSTMIEKAIIPPSRERNVLSESDLQKPKVYQVTKKFIKDVVL